MKGSSLISTPEASKGNKWTLMEQETRMIAIEGSEYDFRKFSLVLDGRLWPGAQSSRRVCEGFGKNGEQIVQILRPEAKNRTRIEIYLWRDLHTFNTLWL
jgi:hypothetical protein